MSDALEQLVWVTQWPWTAGSGSRQSVAMFIWKMITKQWMEWGTHEQTNRSRFHQSLVVLSMLVPSTFEFVDAVPNKIHIPTVFLINVCLWLVWGAPPQTIWGYSITRTFFCPPSTFFWSINLRKDFNLLSIDFNLFSIDFNLLLIN